jgi:hypothetical protein
MSVRFKKNSELSGTLTTKSVQKFGGRPIRGVFKNDDLQREVKSLPVEFKQIGDRTIEGLFSVFGYVDSTYDSVEPGAFTKTIAENSRRFRHLWQHEMDLPPIAVVDQVWEVRRDELPESVIAMTDGAATGGAMVKRTYLENNELSNWVLEGIIEKALNEMSFAFDTIKWEFEDRDPDDMWSWPIRHIKELRLYETSDVNWGANDATIGALKMIEDEGLPKDQKASDIKPEQIFEIFKSIHSGELKLEPGIFESSPELFEFAKRLDPVEQPKADTPPADPPAIEDGKKSLDDSAMSLERMRMDLDRFKFGMEN